MNRIYFALIAAALVVASSFWAGWEWRDRSCDVVEQTRNAADATQTAKAATGALHTEHASQATVAPVQAQAAQQREAHSEATRIIYRDVIKYAQSNPAAGDHACDLDPVGLRAWRAANAGTAAAEPDGQRGSDARPGDDPAAGVARAR